MRRVVVFGAFVMVAFCSVVAQEMQDQPVTAPKPVVAPIARLRAAKTAYVKNMDGSAIGSDTVTMTLEGWGRYQLVNSADKADLLIEVTSPSDAEGGVSVSSSTSTASGKYEQSNKTSRELSSSGGPMRMVVRDAKTRTTLWFASEQVKGAMKKNARENNLVEAAQKLMAKFHDRVEPVSAVK